MATWCDIGVNLGNSRFDHDREQVVARALAAGVDRLIITGTSVAGSEQAAALAGSYTGCWFTAGVHPHDAARVTAGWQQQLRTLLSDPKALAVGECGLDFDRDFSPRPVQEAVFEAQLELAAAVHKPLFLHERAASERQLALLGSWRARLAGGVQHCFTGDLATLRRYLDLDLYIGITGWICDERRGLPLRDLLRYIPAERLLVETDAPYLTPRDLRPKPRDGRNEPAFLPHIAAQVAAARGDDLESLAAQLNANGRRLFGPAL